ncbi:MAG: stage IV sporulation protein A [Oscillospiraceae bacterium]|nr:stage IV sporulation protein A [Oscillospiraceae bacterium]
MKDSSVYRDIAARTNGDIYIGVVGPVRTGKSTFIKKFMETLVIPNIENDYRRERATDELPQSAAGKTIMTTEPKFVPEEAVEMNLDGETNLRVRLIDCVGYIVPSAIGYFENNAPRMVLTPWFDEEIPFNMAAEIGTDKVITEHSTIGLVVTSDGSISDIPREEYRDAEQRVISELKAIDKPFAVILNCAEPESASAKEIAAEMEAEYGVPVIALNCLKIAENDIKKILSEVLGTFPIREIAVDMPKWLVSLEKEHWLRKAVVEPIVSAAKNIAKISEVRNIVPAVSGCEYVKEAAVKNIDLGTGKADVTVIINPELFYKILSEETGLEINGESGLMPCMRELAEIKRKYDRIRGALDQVEAVGYGIVMPTIDELTLEEPEIVRQGGKYGVKLRASAPSIHLMRADITTEVAPIVGSEKQSEDLVRYLLDEFEGDPAKIWESNIFGKSLHELVNEGLHTKLSRMPQEARLKLQETISRIINEGCSGLICLIL